MEGLTMARRNLPAIQWKSKLITLNVQRKERYGGAP